MDVCLLYILMLFVIASRYFIKVSSRDDIGARNIRINFNRQIDSILPFEKYYETYEGNKEKEKKKKTCKRQKLRQPNRYFMFLRLSISAPFPERFLVADYFRDLVFQ